MAITFVASGTTSSTSGTAPTPGLPAGLNDNDLMVLFFFSRHTGSGTMSVSTSGWQKIFNQVTPFGTLSVYWKLRVTGDVAPTISISGYTTGAAGDDSLAHIAAFRGVDVSSPWGTSALTVNNGYTSQQDIGAITGLSLLAGNAVLVLGGKLDDWTSVATLTGDGLTWNEIGDFSSTAGNDAGAVWDYAINAGSTVTVTSKTFVVTGGVVANSRGLMLQINASGTPLGGISTNNGSPAAYNSTGPTADTVTDIAFQNGSPRSYDATNVNTLFPRTQVYVGSG